MEAKPTAPRRQYMPAYRPDENDGQFESERNLEAALLRLANTHAEGIATVDLMDLVRDIADACDACRVRGTTQASVNSIIEDTFGAHTDKEIARAEIKANASSAEGSA